MEMKQLEWNLFQQFHFIYNWLVCWKEWGEWSTVLRRRFTLVLERNGLPDLPKAFSELCESSNFRWNLFCLHFEFPRNSCNPKRRITRESSHYDQQKTDCAAKDCYERTRKKNRRKSITWVRIVNKMGLETLACGCKWADVLGMAIREPRGEAAECLHLGCQRARENVAWSIVSLLLVRSLKHEWHFSKTHTKVSRFWLTGVFVVLRMLVFQPQIQLTIETKLQRIFASHKAVLLSIFFLHPKPLVSKLFQA